MKLVRPRFGENLNTAIPELVLLRRERILIDADLANSRLWRQLASGKAVDHYWCIGVHNFLLSGLDLFVLNYERENSVKKPPRRKPLSDARA